MTRARTYKKGKGVIFLGAGAAKQDGAPIQKELMRDFVEIYNDPPPEILLGTRTIQRNDILHIFNRLSKFFNEFFGIDLRNRNFVIGEYPTFEEILGIIDLRDSNQMKFLENGIPYSKENISKYRNNLRLFKFYPKIVPYSENKWVIYSKKLDKI